MAKARAVAAPAASTNFTESGRWNFVSGSNGAPPPTAPTPTSAELDVEDGDWAVEVAKREAAEGLDVVPPMVVRTVLPDPPVFRSAPAPVGPGKHVDLSPLPARFSLEVERKADGIWKVTAPGVHAGLFVADRDISAALARTPGVLAEIVGIDGVTPVKRPGRKARS